MTYRYQKIKLKDGTTRDAHRLIMEEIIGRELLSIEVVHHKDDNGRNNSIDNLMLLFSWCHKRLHQLNKPFSTEHKEKLSIASRGSNNNNATVDEEVVLQIKTMLRDTNLTHKEISKIFGVGLRCIDHISEGNSWKHVNLPL